MEGSLWGQGVGALAQPWIHVTQAQETEFVFSPERALGTTRWGRSVGGHPLPSGVLLGVALSPRRDAISPRRGRGAVTPSPGARLGGRWVWGGSGAGDGGGRSCGGSGTSGRSPKSAVRWAGECRRERGLLGRSHWGHAGLGSELRRKWPYGARCPVEPRPENRGPIERKRPRLDPARFPPTQPRKLPQAPARPWLCPHRPGYLSPCGGKGPPNKEASLAGPCPSA